MWGDLVGLDFGGGGGGDFFSGLLDALFKGAGEFGGQALDSVANNPFGALGAGIQGAGALGGMFNDAPQMPEMGQFSQMQQPGGPTNQQMARQRLGKSQEQGMSGASPDFLATLAGVTPAELSQMMGWGGPQA